jgi:hypothetical protein
MSPELVAALIGAGAALLGVWLEGFLDAGRQSRARYTDLRLRVYGQVIGLINQAERIVDAAFPPGGVYNSNEGLARDLTATLWELDRRFGELELLDDQPVVREAVAVRVHLRALESLMKSGGPKGPAFWAWEMHRSPLKTSLHVLRAAAKDVTVQGELGAVHGLRLRFLRIFKPSKFEVQKKLREDPFRTDIH